MIIYCAHAYEGKEHNFRECTQIIQELQSNDVDNCYLSPLHALSYLTYNQLGQDKERELCIDLLSMCQAVYVLKDNGSKGVAYEIEMANKMDIPVFYYEPGEIIDWKEVL